MKVLIIENEIYLAQSISIKLSDVGYNCDIIDTYDELNQEKFYDIVLLSTHTDNFLKAVERFKKSIVILMISYISTDTVADPLKIGASDYIQKPFMIEELLRKIEHYQEFKKISTLNRTYKNYIDSRLEKIKLPSYNYKKIKLPLMIKSSKQNFADAFVFNYVKECNKTLFYIDLSINSSTEQIVQFCTQNELLFLSNFQALKGTEREKILELIQNKAVILHTSVHSENLGFHCIDFDHSEKSINSSEILAIDEYVKYIILTYQNIFSDTELAKKLGISRKSLWEKRKKYGISRKK